MLKTLIWIYALAGTAYFLLYAGGFQYVGRWAVSDLFSVFMNPFIAPLVLAVLVLRWLFSRR